MKDLEKYIDLSLIKLGAYRLLSKIDNQTGFPYNLDIDDSDELKVVAKKEYMKSKIGGSEEQILVFLI
jgi:hypothetical protein